MDSVLFNPAKGVFGNPPPTTCRPIVRLEETVLPLIWQRKEALWFVYQLTNKTMGMIVFEYQDIMETSESAFHRERRKLIWKGETELTREEIIKFCEGLRYRDVPHSFFIWERLVSEPPPELGD